MKGSDFVVAKDVPAWKVPGSEQLRSVKETGEERVIHDPSLESIEIGKTHMATTGTKFSMISRETHDLWEKTVDDGSDKTQNENITIMRSNAYLPAMKETVSGKTGLHFRSSLGVGGRRNYYVLSDGDRWVFVDEDTLSAISQARRHGIAVYTSGGEKYGMYRYRGTETDEYTGECYIRERQAKGGMERAVIASPMRPLLGAPPEAVPEVSTRAINPFTGGKIKQYATRVLFRDKPVPDDLHGTPIADKMGTTGAVFSDDYMQWLKKMKRADQFMNFIQTARMRYVMKNGNLIGKNDEQALQAFRQMIAAKTNYLGSGTSADVYGIDNDPYAKNANTAFKFATPVGYLPSGGGMRHKDSILERYVQMYEEVFAMLIIKGPHAPKVHYIVDELYDHLVSLFKGKKPIMGDPMTERKVIESLSQFQNNQPLVGFATDNYPGKAPRYNIMQFMGTNERIGKVLMFVRRAVSAVLAVHDAGLVHGDISANNLMYDVDTDYLTVIDFQMSLDVTLQDYGMDTSIIARTVPYITMAPWVGRVDPLKPQNKKTTVIARQWGDLWGIAIIALMLLLDVDQTAVHDMIYPTPWNRRTKEPCSWIGLVKSDLLTIANCADDIHAKIENTLSLIQRVKTSKQGNEDNTNLVDIFNTLFLVPYKVSPSAPTGVRSLESEIANRVMKLRVEYVSNLPPLPPLNKDISSDAPEAQAELFEVSPMSEGSPPGEQSIVETPRAESQNIVTTLSRPMELQVPVDQSEIQFIPAPSDPMDLELTPDEVYPFIPLGRIDTLFRPIECGPWGISPEGEQDVSRTMMFDDIGTGAKFASVLDSTANTDKTAALHVNKTGAVFEDELLEQMKRGALVPKNQMSWIQFIRRYFEMRNKRIIDAGDTRAIAVFRSKLQPQPQHTGSEDVYRTQKDTYAGDGVTEFKLKTPVGAAPARRLETVLQRYISMYEEILVMLMIKEPYAYNVYYIVDELYDRLKEELDKMAAKGVILDMRNTDPPPNIIQMLNEFPNNAPLVGFAMDAFPGDFPVRSLLENMSISQRIPKVYTFLRRALEITIAIHDSGLMHGWLSSGNMLFDIETGRVSITDFDSSLHYILGSYKMNRALLYATTPEITYSPWNGNVHITPTVKHETTIQERQWGDLWSIGIIAVMMLFNIDAVTVHDYIYPVPWNKRRDGDCSWVSLGFGHVVDNARCAPAIHANVQKQAERILSIPVSERKSEEKKRAIVDILQTILFIPYSYNEAFTVPLIRLPHEIENRVQSLREKYVANLPQLPPLDRYPGGRDIMPPPAASQYVSDDVSTSQQDSAITASTGVTADTLSGNPMNVDDLSVWIDRALTEKGATYVAMCRPGHLVQAGKPNVFADVYSITKSVFGLLVACAHMRYSEGQYPRERYNVLDTATSMMSRHGTNPDDINKAAAVVAEVRLNDMLTQTSGVDTKPIGYSDIIAFQKRGGVDLAVWAANKVRCMRPTYMQGQSAPFKYDNVMTQMAEFAYAHRMRQIRGMESKGAWRGFTTKEEGLNTIFANVDMDIEWEEGKVDTREMSSTMVFMGIKMRGHQLLALGKYLVSDPHWRKTLEFIHGWKHAASVEGQGYENRRGWRYSFLWWIPNEKDFDGMRYLVAIGLFGQYLVINLGTEDKPKSYVAVRQHNIDAEDIRNLMISPEHLDEHPMFVHHVHRIFMKEFE